MQAKSSVIPPQSSAPSFTSCCGSLTGSERSITASRKLKMAVLAPMPSASEMRATNVIAGVRSIERRP